MLAITSAKTKRRPRRGVAPGQGLRAKFALTYILLIAAVLIILNTYPVIASQDLVFRSKRDSLQSQASLLSSGLAGLDAVTTDGVSQVMEQLALQNLTQVMVTDSQGLVVSTMPWAVRTFSTPLSPPACSKAGRPPRWPAAARCWAGYACLNMTPPRAD